MTQTWNSITSLVPADARQIQEAAGVTQFPSQYEWNQIRFGLLEQGGRITTPVPAGGSVVVSFSAPYELQVLDISITPIGPTPVAHSVDLIGLNGFTIINGSAAAAQFFWRATGV